MSRACNRLHFTNPQLGRSPAGTGAGSGGGKEVVKGRVAHHSGTIGEKLGLKSESAVHVAANYIAGCLSLADARISEMKFLDAR